MFYRNVKYNIKRDLEDGYGNSCVSRIVQLSLIINVWEIAKLNHWLVRSLKCWVTPWSVVFLLTSSVATVAICCLELKAVWISYRQVPPSLYWRDIIGNWITSKLLLGIINISTDNLLLHENMLFSTVGKLTYLEKKGKTIYPGLNEWRLLFIILFLSWWERVGWCSFIMDTFIGLNVQYLLVALNSHALLFTFLMIRRKADWGISFQRHENVTDGETRGAIRVHLQTGSGGGSDREVHEVSLTESERMMISQMKLFSERNVESFD